MSEYAKSASQQLSELVIAFAKHKITGEPVLIGELTSEQNGKECDCICYGCNGLLEAVNAGKKDAKKRPHFRHKPGAKIDRRKILIARAAILQTFERFGFLTLPSRKREAAFPGLSGANYYQTRSVDSERVAIRNTRHIDTATAELTLDDGRKLLVRITSKFEEPTHFPKDTDKQIALMSIEVDDPAIAGMSLEDLRSRITMVFQVGHWHKHWRDAELHEQALKAAQSEAEKVLDWDADGLLAGFDLSQLSQLQKQETLLHLKAKELLAATNTFRLPAHVVTEKANAPAGELLSDKDGTSAINIPVVTAQMEKAIGDIRPDLILHIDEPMDWFDSDRVLLEITVTNHIDDDRLKKIRGLRIAAVEIDLSQTRGVISLQDLKKMLVDSVECKRWLWHPLEEEISINLRKRLDAIAAVKWANFERKKREITNSSASLVLTKDDLVSRYFELAKQYGEDYSKASFLDESDLHRLSEVKNEIKKLTDNFVAYGYNQMAVKDLLVNLEGNKMIWRLLSIKQNTVIGYRYDSLFEVLNIIRVAGGYIRRFHTVYLIALKVYKPQLAPKQKQFIEQWRAEVRTGWLTGQQDFARNTMYDELLKLLFPEMADSLSKTANQPTGTR